jgi:hypothetical protein
MKIARFVFLLVLVSLTAFSLPRQAQEPATKDLGMGAFANDSGPILLAIDSALVLRDMKNPYVMFWAYMASKDGNKSISIMAKDIVVLYKGKELMLPSVKELRENYKGINNDYDMYRQLGKEALVASWVRLYQFPAKPNFYPLTDIRADLASDSGSVAGFYGFETPLYLKNPGLAKGDKLTFIVRDRKDPNLTGECEVVLK